MAIGRRGGSAVAFTRRMGRVKRSVITLIVADRTTLAAVDTPCRRARADPRELDFDGVNRLPS
jgi:hypothetical protein